MKCDIVLFAERRAKQWINFSHKPNVTDVEEVLKTDESCQCSILSASVDNAKKKNVMTTDIRRLNRQILSILKRGITISSELTTKEP